MATKVDTAEQVRFLVSCIRHTSNGRPEFAAVATELGIVSKGAAQKRYERMLKAHGVSNSKPAEPEPKYGGETPKTSPRKRTAKAPEDGGSPTKKRTMVPRDRPTPIEGSNDAHHNEPKKEWKPETETGTQSDAGEDEALDSEPALSDPPSTDEA
ncbi:hypothetical protein GMORB2_0175 [Geosmithia morbida]|uniref:Myb-like DNA-binding domain-containing protein n=1 Tax=Geosmithia morbida TaxID=1094350 RepID=A0A9P5D9E5_9HYPO|nr:uncharacterized protein GMORB2_0175 [Geosmithia morbida]KAF4126439.1 hypothetical protein GMORB2_0175 [Geosmithia morbida]